MVARLLLLAVALPALADPPRVGELIAQLGHRRYDKRAAASAALYRRNDADTRRALARAAREAPTLEARGRASQLLAGMQLRLAEFPLTDAPEAEEHEVEIARDPTLVWLSHEQRRDGSWCGDVRATGLSLLALVQAGHTHRYGRYKPNVRAALAWLRARRRADGRFASCHAQAHAIASVAIVTCHAYTRSPALRKDAALAVGWLVAQQRNGAWTHLAREGTDERDPTLWAHFAIGLSDVRARGRARAATAKRVAGDVPIEREQARRYTLLRLSTGSRHDAKLRLATRRALARLPRAGEKRFADWLLESWIARDSERHVWQRWRRAIMPAVVDTMETAGADPGSWTPRDRTRLGRVLATARARLILRNFYRYSATPWRR